MGGRLLPGEGELPLVDLLRGLLSKKPGLTVAVEVFSEELKALPAHEIAARVALATRRVLAGCPGAKAPQALDRQAMRSGQALHRTVGLSMLRALQIRRGAAPDAAFTPCRTGTALKPGGLIRREHS